MISDGSLSCHIRRINETTMKNIVMFEIHDWCLRHVMFGGIHPVADERLRCGVPPGSLRSRGAVGPKQSAWLWRLSKGCSCTNPLVYTSYMSARMFSSFVIHQGRVLGHHLAFVIHQGRICTKSLIYAPLFLHIYFI